MVASQAMIGYGSKFYIAPSADSPLDLVEIAEVFNITPPNFTTDQVDVTHNQSPDRTREFIPGLIDPGEASFEMNFIPGSASDDLLNAVRISGDVVACRIIFPNLVRWDFLASITGYEPTVATEDKMTVTVTLKVSGSIDITG